MLMRRISHLLLGFLPRGLEMGQKRKFKGKGRFWPWGQAPIPHYYYHNGIVRKESAGGGQRMGEHALSDKPASSGAGGNGIFPIPGNRVRRAPMMTHCP